MMSQLRVLAIALVAVYLNGVDGQACRRPDRSTGRCISVYDCPSVLAAIQRGVTTEEANNLRALSCTGDTGSFPWVCCELRRNDEGTIFPNDDDGTDQVTQRPPTATRAPPTTGGNTGSGGDLPARGQCGQDDLGNRIYGGTNAGLSEFPWMVLLEYKNALTNQNEFGCGGSLINSRYVMTAAHCYYDPKAANLNLISVRLGEYDTGSDRDCVNDDCADPVVNVGIEQTIPHPQYVANSRNKAHDIALLRLAHDVSYTGFIQPICLPSTVGLQRTAADSKLFASGWGRTLRARKSAIKQKVELPVFDQQSCVQKYAAVNAEISDHQLCAGGLYAVDTCDGDSGGPLMTNQGNYWTAEGVVSFGYKCGLEGWPAIYTRVSSYEPWIRQTIRA